jgi:hypothetical protein
MYYHVIVSYGANSDRNQEYTTDSRLKVRSSINRSDINHCIIVALLDKELVYSSFYGNITCNKLAETNNIQVYEGQFSVIIDKDEPDRTCQELADYLRKALNISFDTDHYGNIGAVVELDCKSLVKKVN